MWLDNEAQDAIEFFWSAAGETEPFPRQLERPLLFALPVALVKLPRLTLWEIERWLHRRGPAISFSCQNRGVRGCLIAFGGKGMIFVDGADPADELRFTIAHEVGHFLVDYLLPRQKAGRRFGPSIWEVMDGMRVPTVAERLYAILDRTQIGVHTNLMDRVPADEHENLGKIEERADRVALELLASHELVLAEPDVSRPTYPERFAAVTAALMSVYGLPLAVARSYAQALLDLAGKGPSFAESLRQR